MFLCCKMAWATLSLSIDPLLLALLLMIFFADFTLASALPFDWGYATDDSLWLVMPQSFINCWNSLDVNWVPPSELISSGHPYAVNIPRHALMRLWDVAWPGGKWNMDIHPLNRSTHDRYEWWPMLK